MRGFFFASVAEWQTPRNLRLRISKSFAAIKMICFFLGHNIVGTHLVITSYAINEVIE